MWQKGRDAPGCDRAIWRQDVCGTLIKRDEYGNQTANGWEIDHMKPVAQGGGDELANLQPLHWENNDYKSDNYPKWSCKRKA